MIFEREKVNQAENVGRGSQEERQGSAEILAGWGLVH